MGVVSGLLGGVVGSILLKKKTPQAQAPVPTPQPTRLEARERAERNDMLARRRGSGPNRRVGFGAGATSIGGKANLLGRS